MRTSDYILTVTIEDHQMMLEDVLAMHSWPFETASMQSMTLERGEEVLRMLIDNNKIKIIDDSVRKRGLIGIIVDTFLVPDAYLKSPKEILDILFEWFRTESITYWPAIYLSLDGALVRR